VGKKIPSLQKQIGAELTALLAQLGLLRARLFSTYEHTCFIELEKNNSKKKQH